MTQMVSPATITAPPIVGRVGELLDVATIHEDLRWLDVLGLFPTFNCLSTDKVAVFPCPTPEDEPEAKTFDSLAWQDGIRFNTYAGLVCKGIGYDLAEAETEAQRVFLANESVGVERALMQQRFVDGDTWDAPTDLTPSGGAVDPTVGLAILEGHASWNYAGAPVIHSPRSVTTLLSRNGAVTRQGNVFYSVQGSPIASGGGYEEPNQGPDGEAPDEGEKWMYSSGGVVIARAGLFVQTEMDRETNEVFTLVERAYVAGVDCYTAAVRVTVSE